jgi:hypothetical protein
MNDLSHICHSWLKAIDCNAHDMCALHKMSLSWMLSFGVMKGKVEKHIFDLKSYMDNEQLPRAKTK